MSKRQLIIAAIFLQCGLFAQTKKVNDKIEPLQPGNISLKGYFENDIQNTLDNWVKGVMPYDSVVNFFSNGREKFALGEMPGKAIRTNSLLYRYNHDPELKELTKKVVYSLIATQRSNGSISCTVEAEQPGGRDGDVWERKYVLLGLSQYYLDVEQDPKVLKAMEDEAASVMNQIGPAPKVSITSLGWSTNRIESSSILEPFMRLYFITGKKEYLDFATYIVNAGGCNGKNIFDSIYDDKPMYEVGVPYPKAYEMTSVMEGLAEYYRATGEERWGRVLANFFKNVSRNEISIIGNGGNDIYFPKLYGEGWGNTTFEQTNPKIKRMMETCVGVTWIKYCSQYLRLTADPVAVDYIEKYVYNGLIGAMRPDGRGFSYVNLLNGSKVTNSGWGTSIDDLPVTCCNLNGPTGLAYIPYVEIMQSAAGPVVNLYNDAVATAKTPSGKDVKLTISGGFPYGSNVAIKVSAAQKEKFNVDLRIPSWSKNTVVKVNGKRVKTCASGSYLTIARKWDSDDTIEVAFDFRAVLINAPEGTNPEGNFFQAVQWGPIVLARDENIDVNYNKPVQVIADANGEVKVTPIKPERKGTRMEFIVPTTEGEIRMIDYSSVDCWEGAHIQTWLPMIR